MEKYLGILRRKNIFSGMRDDEILSILQCMDVRVITCAEGQYIFREGDTTSEMGLVLTGSVLIIQEDFWGYRNIMSRCLPGDFFGEPYAATPGSVLNISVVAETGSDIMMLNVKKMLTTCSNACENHTRMITSLVGVLARKVLIFNDKITHMSRRSTRDKILSYLNAESVRQGSASFDIPYDRQQLADFLCVDRSAMSSELSKLKKEGLIKTQKNHFELLA